MNQANQVISSILSTHEEGLYEALKLLDAAIQSLTMPNPIEGAEQLRENLSKVRELIDKFLQNPLQSSPDRHGLGIILSGSIGSNKRLTETEEELKRTKDELARTNADLLLTRDQLQFTKQALHKTDEELQKTKERLNKTEEELHKTKERLNKAEEELHTAQRESKKQLTSLDEQNRFLTDEVNRLKDQLVDTDLKVAELSKKSKKTTDKQILGDFVYQIQKIIGHAFNEDKDSWMTGSELKEFYQYDATKHQKELLAQMGLKDEKDVRKLATAMEKLKELRFSSAHEALSQNMLISANQLKKIARDGLEDPISGRLITFEPQISQLLDVWNGIMAGGDFFVEKSWTYKKEFEN